MKRAITGEEQSGHGNDSEDEREAIEESEEEPEEQHAEDEAMDRRMIEIAEIGKLFQCHCQ